MLGESLLRAIEIKSILEMPSMTLNIIVMPVSKMSRYKTYCKELIIERILSEILCMSIVLQMFRSGATQFDNK